MLGGAVLPSAAEDRLRGLLAERGGGIVVRPAPEQVVVIDLAVRRCGPLDPRARMLEAGAARLDAVADLEQVKARAAAAQARELAAFARSRPASWDRQPGERGAASAASRAARPPARPR